LPSGINQKDQHEANSLYDTLIRVELIYTSFPVEKILPKHRFVKAIYVPAKKYVFSTPFGTPRSNLVFILETFFTVHNIQQKFKPV